MKQLRVVLDSNVLFSGISWFGNPRLIRRLARQGKFTAITSEFILGEVRKALVEDLDFTEEQAERKVDKIRRFSKVVRPREKIEVIRDDPSDNKILACARRSKASFIVTGDRHLRNEKEYKGIRIVTPRAFMDILREEGII